MADANSLRSRLTSGSPSSARGDELAGLLLEASAFSTWSSLPVNLQIPIDQLSTGATTADQLRNLDSLIATLQDRRKTVAADIDTQSKDLLNNSGYEFLDANAFGNDSVMNAVKQQYPELFAVGDLTQLTDSLDPNNPLAQAADANSKNLLQLVGLENVIAYSTGDQTMTKAVDQLQQEVNQLQAQLEQENAKKQDLTQARDLAWSTYTTLANKVAEVTVASQAKGSVVRLAVPAVPPDQPSAPKKTLNTLLAAVVGLLLAVGSVFLLEFFNEGVKTEEEMGALLGLPMVGAIPELPKLGLEEKIARNGSGVLAVQDPRSATTEAFRLLRHNLFANHSANGAGAEKTSRSLLIASAVPSEGKSTIAANLALLLAHSDRKVVLVDADLRRPSQHRIFGLKNGTGLVNILVESVENWETYAQATDVKDLTVITSGPLPPDPAQLLESLALKRLIEKLKSSCDIVIIDTPAVLGLADAPAVARVTDGILMVVESDGVSRGDAARAKEILASTGVPIIGVVMNRTAAAPGAVTYRYYDHLERTVRASPNGHKGVGAVVAQAQNVWWPEVRDRIVDWVGPRRGA